MSWKPLAHPESPDGLPESPEGWLKVSLHGLTKLFLNQVFAWVNATRAAPCLVFSNCQLHLELLKLAKLYRAPFPYQLPTSSGVSTKSGTTHPYCLTDILAMEVQSMIQLD